MLNVRALIGFKYTFAASPQDSLQEKGRFICIGSYQNIDYSVTYLCFPGGLSYGQENSFNLAPTVSYHQLRYLLAGGLEHQYCAFNLRFSIFRPGKFVPSLKLLCVGPVLFSYNACPDYLSSQRGMGRFLAAVKPLRIPTIANAAKLLKLKRFFINGIDT